MQEPKSEIVKLQLNLSTTAILGTNEYGRYGEAAVIRFYGCNMTPANSEVSTFLYLYNADSVKLTPPPRAVIVARKPSQPRHLTQSKLSSSNLASYVDDSKLFLSFPLIELNAAIEKLDQDLLGVAQWC